MKDQKIEIYCDFCKKVAGKIECETSSKSHQISCQHCAKTVYWLSCEGCGTGWYSSDEEASCPICK